MTRRIAILDGHPDPDRARFVHALADAYAEAAARAGHEVRRVDIATLDFPVLRSKADWDRGAPVPDIAAAQEAIAWAEHLVLLYPMWLGDVPALFKAFLEQVARPGFAIGAGSSARGFEAGLKGRSARVVVTMGMPAPVYRLWFGAHSLKSLRRNILNFVGIRPVRESLVGLVEGSAEARAKWLEKMAALGARGA